MIKISAKLEGGKRDGEAVHRFVEAVSKGDFGKIWEVVDILVKTAS